MEIVSERMHLYFHLLRVNTHLRKMTNI